MFKNIVRRGRIYSIDLSFISYLKNEIDKLIDEKKLATVSVNYLTSNELVDFIDENIRTFYSPGGIIFRVDKDFFDKTLKNWKVDIKEIGNGVIVPNISFSNILI